MNFRDDVLRNKGGCENGGVVVGKLLLERSRRGPEISPQIDLVEVPDLSPKISSRSRPRSFSTVCLHRSAFALSTLPCVLQGTVTGWFLESGYLLSSVRINRYLVRQVIQSTRGSCSRSGVHRSSSNDSFTTRYEKQRCLL